MCHPEITIKTLDAKYGALGDTPKYLDTVYELRNGIVLQNKIIEAGNNNETDDGSNHTDVDSENEVEIIKNVNDNYV